MNTAPQLSVAALDGGLGLRLVHGGRHLWTGTDRFDSYRELDHARRSLMPQEVAGASDTTIVVVGSAGRLGFEAGPDLLDAADGDVNVAVELLVLAFMAVPSV